MRIGGGGGGGGGGAFTEEPLAPVVAEVEGGR